MTNKKLTRKELAACKWYDKHGQSDDIKRGLLGPRMVAAYNAYWDAWEDVAYVRNMIGTILTTSRDIDNEIYRTVNK